MQKRPINDHDFDSLSLEFVYARNMWKNMPHTCGICSIYAACMRRIFRQIPHILPPKVPHILRKFSTINQHLYLVVIVVVVVVVAWTVKSWGGCFNSHEVCSTSGTSGSMSIVDRGLPEPTWLSGHSIVLLSAMCQPTCIRLLVSSSSSSSSSASSSSIKSREHHRLEK